MSLIIPANTLASGGFSVDNSLRFNDGSSDYLNRTLSATGNQKKWTWSAWVKISNTASGDRFLWSSNNGHSGGGNFSSIFFGNNTLRFYNYSGGIDNELKTNRLFRDVSAFYHLMVVYDSANGTADNRIKMYVNGVQETSFATRNNPALNYNSYVENNYRMYLGSQNGSESYFDGYLAEPVFVNNQALAPTEFAEADEDSGIWKPKSVSGLTFGTNGFYLDFENSGALGADVSGNTNNFTVNNLTAIDQTTDTCTNNFATMNPLAYRLDSGVSLPTYSEGNTVVSYADDSGAGKSTMATIGFENGKWYWEYKVGTANDTIFGGITRMDYDPNDNFAGRSCYYNKTGAFSVGTGTGGTADGSYGNSYTTGDIIGVAFDCDNGVIWFSKNGTWQNSATQSEIEAGTTTNSATTGITLNQFWSPFFEGANGGMSANFGSPAFAISSGNTDGNGYGNFEYAVPSGYYSLNTKNLAEYG
jgi:hypothetical protein